MADKIAVISDIHGNIPALEATLEDIDRRDIDTIYCLGDLVGKGPYPEQAVDICRRRCKVVLRGNWDEYICGKTDDESICWHQTRLGQERMSYLAGLPNSIDFKMSGRHIRFFHASHLSVHHRVFPYESYEKIREMFSNTDFTGRTPSEPDVVGYGDIHLAYTLTLISLHKTIFNTGSVGVPADEPKASYAILEGNMDGDTADVFSICNVRLPYDIELAVAQAVKEKTPELEPYIVELRTAVYRGLQQK